MRYFGGTLLGVPGLIQAYKAATLDAVSNSVIIDKTVNITFKVSCDYLQLNSVMKVIKDSDLEVKSQSFDLQCDFVLEVRQKDAVELRSRLEHIDALKVELQ